MPGRSRASVVGAEAEGREPARPVALQHHVRFGQRGRERGPVGRIAQIGERRALAAAGVGDGLDVRQRAAR